MKARLVMSRVQSVPTPMGLAEMVAHLCSQHRLCANVTPMYSSVHAKAFGDYRVEPAVTIDILSFVTTYQVLLFWQALQRKFGVHCVWLDYELEGGTENHNGCICEWSFYLKNYLAIDHDKPLKCSEY